MAERTDRVGQRFGDYWLRRRLGGGGFGDVYLGEQVQDHSLVAVKVLQIRLTQSKDLREFINEVRTFRLQHPHIVRLLDVGIAEDDTPFLVMDYASGGTLRDRHPKGSQLPLALVLTYVTPIASALQYAHDRQLIHRDVKPENMLLGPEGQVWLSDFGIAVVAQSTHSLHTHRGVGGTLPYMAPEQIYGVPRKASDQYALGIIVYEWLCGIRPFSGTMVELITKQSTVPPAPLRTHIPTLATEVEQVVLLALAKDPKDRFKSVQDFATALVQAAQATSEQALPPSMSIESSNTIEPSWRGAEVEAEQQQTIRSVLPSPQTKVPFPSSSTAELVSESNPSSSPTSSEAVTSSAILHPSLHDTASHPLGDQSASSGVSVATKPRVPTTRQDPSRRQVLVGLAALTVVGGGVIWWRVSQSSSPTTTPAGNTQTPTTGNTPTTATTATATPSGPTKAIAIDTSTGTFGFNPTTITIKVGTTVTWTNTTSAPHTVTSDDGTSFDSSITTPISANGGTFSFTFTKAGTFAYHCQIHPFMKATIIVQS